MKINTKITIFLAVSFFLMVFSLGLVSVHGLSRSQRENLLVSKNELLEISRGLVRESAGLFFSFLDQKISADGITDVDGVSRVVSEIGKGKYSDLIIIDIKKKRVLPEFEGSSFMPFLDQSRIDDFSEKSLLLGQKSFYLDNYALFLEGKGDIVPTAIYFQQYEHFGILVGFGKTMDAVGLRIEYMKKKNADYFRNQCFFFIGVFVLAALLAVIVSVVFMQAFFILPLKKISDVVERVGKGDLAARIAFRSKDEIGDLANVFDQMTDNLQSVTASRDELNREIAERLIAEEKLEAAYKQLKDAQSQLIQSEKMASLGLLSAGVAHEINNPLGFVMGNLSTLQDYLNEYIHVLKAAEELIGLVDAVPREEIIHRVEQFRQLEHDRKIEVIIKDTSLLLDETLVGLKRVQKIVLDLKTFARADSNTMQKADVNKMLDNAVRMLGKELEYKIELVKDYGKVPPVMCREQRIEQVFMNLLLNASQAIEGRGIVRLVTSVKDGMLCVEVVDNGHGIPPENLDKIFDPFFTTKPVGKGTGLGLSVSYDIIKQHRGEILVESEPGRGTKFTVLLPLKDTLVFPLNV